jgi:hypothetical protein
LTRDLYSIHAPFVVAFFLFALVFVIAHLRSGKV